MSRKIQKTARKAARIAARLAEAKRLYSEFREAEEADYKGKQALLKKLAGYFWRNEEFVASEKNDSDTDSKSVSVADFPERFTLIRLGKKITVESLDGQTPASGHETTGTDPGIYVPLMRAIEIAFAKDLEERAKAAQMRGSTFTVVDAIKESQILLAPFLFTIEEWARIFPDAARADDYDFIDRSVRSFRKQQPSRLENRDIRSIGFFWHGFQMLGIGDMIPPLKHWSDRAACEWVRFYLREHTLKLVAYKQRKSRTRLHSEKPTLVTGARYVCEGDAHILKCWR